MDRHLLRLALFVALGAVAACGSGSRGGNAGGASGTATGAGGGDSQKLPIGSPCATDADCGGGDFMCMTDHPDGYCVEMCDIGNGDADCPSGSICQFDGTVGECHLKCDTIADCRTGYTCAPAATDPTNTASHAFCDVAD